MLRTFHGGLKIKILGIKTNKLGIAARQDSIDHELDEVQQACGSTHVTRVDNVSPRNCDASAVRISLLGPDLSHHAVLRDVVEADESESISARNTLIARAIGTLANTLAQPS